jgi:hypothetical protein
MKRIAAPDETLPALHAGIRLSRLLEDGSAESDMGRFFIKNSQFGWLDARAVCHLVRAWRRNG